MVYELRPGPRASVVTVELRDADPRLLAGLRTQPGRPLDDVALQEDARVLVSRLAERGHFEASVEAEVPEGGGSLAVLFLAQPGPRAVVRSVEVAGPPLPPSGDAARPPGLALRQTAPPTACATWPAAGTPWCPPGYGPATSMSGSGPR